MPLTKRISQQHLEPCASSENSDGVWLFVTRWRRRGGFLRRRPIGWGSCRCSRRCSSSGVAVSVRRWRRLEQAVEREVGERVGFDELADLFDGLVGGDEVALAGRVDAVEAGRDGGRATDAEMDFFGAGAADHADDLSRLVVPRMMESSMRMTRLPSRRLRTGLSLRRTPKSRTRCSGSMKVRPT